MQPDPVRGHFGLYRGCMSQTFSKRSVSQTSVGFDVQIVPGVLGSNRTGAVIRNENPTCCRLEVVQ